jgi:putative FmdB family regulatory protein
MPIYEYRCTSCGFQKEYLQKVTDPLMTVCPECGKGTFSKMLTAAGFQLKGSGWYATDFRNGGAKPAAKAGNEAGKADGETVAKSESKTESKPESKVEAKSEGKKETKTESPKSGSGASAG